MVEVRIREDSRARLSSFFASGHAGWAEDGQDVVCAAVSTILQSAWLGLTEIMGIQVTGSRSRSESQGRLELSWPIQVRDDAGVRAIVNTAALSIERLALQFPDHVRAIRETTDG